MKRSPAAAFWLSLLPGLGHLYLGLTVKGIVFALLTVGLFDILDRGTDAFGIFVPIYWLFVMLDAHRSAQTINRGDAAPDWLKGAGSRWWGGALIGLGALFLLYNFGLFDFEWLWRFWPAALIVVGIKLLWPAPASPAPAVPSTSEPPQPVDEVATRLDDSMAPASEEKVPGSSNEGDDSHERTEAR